jgi:hypothetical protein
MPAPQVYARYSGQETGFGFSYSLGWGIRPSTISVTMPVGQGNFQPVDSFQIFQTEPQGQLEIRDCRLVSASAPTGTTQAPVIELQLQDPRWKWQFGKIDGDYNAEQPYTTTLLREKTPQELASLLLDAMGAVEDYDVSQLPNDSRPRASWSAANPAVALEQLVTSLGCVVCYDPFEEFVTICPVGSGSSIPGGAKVSYAPAYTAPAWPDEIRVVGGPAMFQTVLKLGEPQAQDMDGKYYPQDDVSYAPGDGWGKLFPSEYEGIEGSTTVNGETIYYRELAAANIWKCYKILGQVDDEISPMLLRDGDYEPTVIADLGPFQNFRLEKDQETGARLPAVVRGLYADSRNGFENTEPNAMYGERNEDGEQGGSFSIDSENKLVRFSEPVFKFTADTEEATTEDVVEAAELFLICAYSASKDGVPIRYEQWLENEGQTYGAGPMLEHHPELVREVIEGAASNGGTGASEDVDNLEQIETQADYYLEAIARQFVNAQGEVAVYDGIRADIRLDGSIRSISYSGSVSSTPTTSVGKNTEPNNYAPKWEDRPEYRATKRGEEIGRQNLFLVKRLIRRSGVEVA